MADQCDLTTWKALRQRARTDLHFLCKEILGYKDLDDVAHLKMCGHLQRFKGGTELLDYVTAKTGAGYTPFCSMWELKGKRKKLSLVTRGGLKTSVLTIAHSIQWIINYPDVRILLVSAKLGRAQDFLKGIKRHFVENEVFRWLFPEYCPKLTKAGKMEDFGDSEQFTVPCRRSTVEKEPTCRCASADSSVAGGHYDVMKVDDIVEDQNTRTPGGIEQTKLFFGALWPLLQQHELEPHHGWQDVTGTIYHFADLHSTIYMSESKKAAEQRGWSIYYESAAPNYPNGPFWWEKRLPLSALKAIENDPSQGMKVLSPQYLLKPLQDKNGLISTVDDIRWIPAKVLRSYSARIAWNVTVDLAGMNPGAKRVAENDYETINLHGWGTDGRCYFRKIWWGRYTPEQVISILFDCMRIEPRIMFIKIEKEAHSQVLMPFLQKAQSNPELNPFRKEYYLPIMDIERDNQASKELRIRGTQPYWRTKAFVFCEPDEVNDGFGIDAATRNQLEMEALYFPKFDHDDVLDTIADALQSRDGITHDVEGRERSPESPMESDYREWKGIPVSNLSWAMLQGMTDEEFERDVVG
jgi:hypothetical protein